MDPTAPLINFFLLSTFRDLAAYREVVARAVNMQRFSGEMPLNWAAYPEDGDAHNSATLAQADCVILIVAHWYGATSETDPTSITEKLYLEAVEAGIPVTAFFIDDTIPWPPAHIQFDALDRLRAFKAKVQESARVWTIQTPEQCAKLALVAVQGSLQAAHASPLLSRRPPSPISPAELTTTADALVSIGTSVEGLPYWLSINRLERMSEQLSLISKAMSGVENTALLALTADLKKGISHYTYVTTQALAFAASDHIIWEWT